jgi:hypothetical protein
MQSFFEYASKKSKDKTNRELRSFFTDRKNGAMRIKGQTQSKDKDDPAKLTFFHFDEKIKTYILNISRLSNDKNFFRAKFLTILSKLRNLDFDQEEFQRLSGELEVYGEILAELK